ncbi:T6SS immunity protein Tli4 family protein [Rugamonas sp. DEMB1]|uniref:T6SS immunity protein Tli4 family protein n=1 Tax=Rugamonas sp. DEMB1 TaxID=3039386 RepID=UPI002446AF23|nr:T6SS immunity protein Tli4 family protein [Rugamonas sp. DEMB1]WGG53024.1 T6SS immunity protein Tli4 family protein [Rugamonas sp. DEMB1]
MKIAVKHPLTGFLAAMAVAVLASWWSVGMVHDVLETGKVARMTETMKTICVGRFLIDVPAEARVSFRGAFLSGWNISIYPDETDEQFFARLADQEAELKDAKNRAGGENLESTIGVDREGVHGKIFVFGRTWTHWIEDGKRVDSTAVAVHAYVHTQRTSLNFTAKSLDEDDTRELAKIARQIKPLKEGEVPTEPGFCFGRAMIKDPLLASQHERVTMFLNLKDHPDFGIAFYTAAGLKPGKSLLARDDAIKQEFEAYVHTFRRGGRSIAGVPGDEICERFSELNGTTAHSCEWESFSKQDDVFRPELSLEITTGFSRRPGGQPVESSLSDAGVLALWDKISSSIRVRPTKTIQPLLAPAVPSAATAAPH